MRVPFLYGIFHPVGAKEGRLLGRLGRRECLWTTPGLRRRKREHADSSVGAAPGLAFWKTRPRAARKSHFLSFLSPPQHPKAICASLCGISWSEPHQPVVTSPPRPMRFAVSTSRMALEEGLLVESVQHQEKVTSIFSRDEADIYDFSRAH